MDRKRKEELGLYYAGDKCRCGQTKMRMRWKCLSCLKKYISTPESDELDQACTKHFEAAERYLELISLTGSEVK